MKKDIWIEGPILQDFYYENIWDKMLSKGQKIATELTHGKTTNDTLEACVKLYIGTLTREIKFLTSKMHNLL
jgi:hypothetical protein